eukprot:CAMPEP_0197592788 /NCGR_PEP_ID=MMETSP1326-20131121/15807_1 /TAXON_ID=1155430 /ORGANISM="Genus nov. species nov., Strain RCC2288" /LENGTH=658 /DNA_ID=CAMNT_0043158559 /DNA_START=185 /DNA_END=2161 /DNA_ORIENTATION=-
MVASHGLRFAAAAAAVAAMFVCLAPLALVRADNMDCDIRMRANCGFGMDGKMPGGQSAQKEMAMQLCSPLCKTTLTSKDCKGAGWDKTMTKRVLKNCKTLDDAKAKAKQKAAEDPKRQEYESKNDEADRKRKYAEGCRDMLDYECGVSNRGDHHRAVELMCTDKCTQAIQSVMCQEAGITEEKINRKSMCGEVNPKSKKFDKDSARPVECQKGLKTVCGIDTDSARESPDKFGEDGVDYETLCSPACVKLVNGPHCKAMKLDPSLNSPEMCAKLKCRLTSEDEAICEADLCDVNCKLSTPECVGIATQVGITAVKLAECRVKRGEMTQQELDGMISMQQQEGDGASDSPPPFDPACIDHDACKGGEGFCQSDCPLGTLECTNTRRTLGLGGRAWEVQCTAESYGPKPCEEFDAAAVAVAEECRFEEKLGPDWKDIEMDMLCDNAFGEGSNCAAIAQSKLLGYSLKCMLDNERRNMMADGSMSYKGPNHVVTGLVNMFFFECPASSTGNVWINEPGFVKPIRHRGTQDGPGGHNNQLGVDGEEDEDLSLDADDEADVSKTSKKGGKWDAKERWDDLEEEEASAKRKSGSSSSSGGRVRKQVPLEELGLDFKARFELGKLSEDETMRLLDEDLQEYIEAGHMDKKTKSTYDKKTNTNDEL